jgi:uncharacterized protein with PQ loop repeat
MRAINALLLTANVGLFAWLGYGILMDSFPGPRPETVARWLAFAMLGAFYAASLLATVWFVRLIYRVAYKLAGTGNMDVSKANSQALLVLIADAYSRLLATWLRTNQGTQLGMIAFAAPALLALWLIAQDSSLRRARKLVALSPLLLFIVADAALAMWMGAR